MRSGPEVAVVFQQALFLVTKLAEAFPPNNLSYTYEFQDYSYIFMGQEFAVEVKCISTLYPDTRDGN